MCVWKSFRIPCRPLGSLQHIIFCYWDVALMVENTTWKEGAHAWVAKLELLIEHLSKKNDPEEFSEVVYHKHPIPERIFTDFKFHPVSRNKLGIHANGKHQFIGAIYSKCVQTLSYVTRKPWTICIYIYIYRNIYVHIIHNTWTMIYRSGDQLYIPQLFDAHLTSQTLTAYLPQPPRFQSCARSCLWSRVEK